MSGKDVFLSVGGTANDRQEAFVTALEQRLRAEGLVPNTVGRNTFSSDAPLTTVERLMSACSGTIVVALERTYFPQGVQKRGGDKEQAMGETRLATPWNQIEAAMSYSRGLPLLVLVQEGIREEGLLEPGYDWYVHAVPLDVSALNSQAFNGILASWKEKLKPPGDQAAPAQDTAPVTPETLTIGQIIGAMRPAQLWSILAACGGVIAVAFALGAQLIG